MSYLAKIADLFKTADEAEQQFLLTHVEEVSGSSLSRIWQHVENKDVAFGIITAYKSTKNRAENIAATMQLASDLRQAGYGYFWLKGYWTEAGEPAAESDAEASLFVRADPGEEAKLHHLLVKLMFKYDQFAFAWKKEGEQEVWGVNRDGSKQRYGAFHPDRIANAYSKIMSGKHAGRTFTFASAWSRQDHQAHASIRSYLKEQGLIK